MLMAAVHVHHSLVHTRDKRLSRLIQQIMHATLIYAECIMQSLTHKLKVCVCVATSGSQ